MPAHCWALIALVPLSVRRSMITASLRSRNGLYRASFKYWIRSFSVESWIGSTLLIRNGSMMVLCCIAAKVLKRGEVGYDDGHILGVSPIGFRLRKLRRNPIGVALSAIAALPQRVLLPLRWLPAVASSQAQHQRFACDRLPLRSLTQISPSNGRLH